MKILIVDDDQGMRNSLRVGLTAGGHDVFVANNAASAITLLENGTTDIETPSIDMVITDLKMPGVNGLKLAQRVKASCPEIPIILMTAYGNKHVYKSVKHLKISGYIEKPFKPDALLELINETHRKKGGRQ